MKVMIEADLNAEGEQGHAIYAAGAFVAGWYQRQNGEYFAYFPRGGGMVFPSEPAARAWVLEQLNAKEVQP